MIDLHTLNVLMIAHSGSESRLIVPHLVSEHNSGFRVRTADSLVAGIQQIQTEDEDTDVVLLDLILPDSSGIETYRSVREITEAPIIVMTGQEEAAVEAMEAGAQDSLIKGRFDRYTLKRAVRHAITRERLHKALLDQRRDYRTIIEHHPDGVVVVDDDGVVLFANQSAEILFGSKPGRLVRQHFGYPLADETTLVSLIQPSMGGTIKVTAELRAVQADWEGHSARLVFVRDVSALVREQIIIDRTMLEPLTPVSQMHFSVRSLRQERPSEFEALCAAYTQLLEEALDVRAFKSTEVFDRTLNAFADRLVASHPGPRDLIELHTHVLRKKLADAADVRAKAYLEEGRLLVLNLMGRLVTFYRPYALSGAQASSGDTSCRSC